MPGTLCASLADYTALMAQGGAAQRQAIERSLITDSERFDVPGYCSFCNAPSRFQVDFLHSSPEPVDGMRVPNWREWLICRRCQLNNRLRATIHLLRSTVLRDRSQIVYATEQSTAFYAALHQLFPRAIGSEYLRDGTQPGQVNARNLRHEDLTNLTFADRSLDHICSCDVLEHVPDYRRALTECFRCLKEDGTMVISVPFLPDAYTTLVRARLRPDGSIEHLTQPEYHHDPLDSAGTLCFHHFGWDILDTLRAIGFAEAKVLLYWSAEMGYLGGLQQLITARKAA